MVTDGHMATATEFLTLAQWFSPAFPIGAFAYSHGMEWSIENGDISDAATAQAWIATVLRSGSGWNDAILIANAYRAKDALEVELIDATGKALCSSRERVLETQLQGAAFCQTVENVWGAELKGLILPVAVGKAAQLHALPLETVIQMYLQAFATNLSSVAMRLVPLGQTEGQKLICNLNALCIEIAGSTLNAELDELSSTTFAADIAAMKHETQYARVFRT